MTEDIFKYWADIPPTALMHPRDRTVLERSGHGFDLHCLPSAFYGPLKSAKVVLLFSSPGLSDMDAAEATTEAGQARYVATRTGTKLLPSREEYEPAWRWWTERTRRFGDAEHLRDKIAILNISPYKSPRVRSRAMLAALPSCRVAIGWAQAVLFPEAERGDRVVVCLRAAAEWGLGIRGLYGKALFAPETTQRGHMKHGHFSDEVVRAVRLAVGPP